MDRGLIARVQTAFPHSSVSYHAVNEIPNFGVFLKDHQPSIAHLLGCRSAPCKGNPIGYEQYVLFDRRDKEEREVVVARPSAAFLRQFMKNGSVPGYLDFFVHYKAARRMDMFVAKTQVRKEYKHQPYVGDLHSIPRNQLLIDTL